jgi:hypothetical protein
MSFLCTKDQFDAVSPQDYGKVWGEDAAELFNNIVYNKIDTETNVPFCSVQSVPWKTSGGNSWFELLQLQPAKHELDHKVNFVSTLGKALVLPVPVFLVVNNNFWCAILLTCEDGNPLQGEFFIPFMRFNDKKENQVFEKVGIFFRGNLANILRHLPIVRGLTAKKVCVPIRSANGSILGAELDWWFNETLTDRGSWTYLSSDPTRVVSELQRMNDQTFYFPGTSVMAACRRIHNGVALLAFTIGKAGKFTVTLLGTIKESVKDKGPILVERMELAKANTITRGGVKRQTVEEGEEEDDRASKMLKADGGEKKRNDDLGWGFL